MFSDDPGKARNAFRRALLHVLRMEQSLDQLVAMHQRPDGQMLDVSEMVRKLEQTHKALFGDRGDGDPVSYLGVVEVIHRLDEGRKLLCKMFYAIIATLGVVGALVAWSIDIGSKIEIRLKREENEEVQAKQDDVAGRRDHRGRTGPGVDP